MVYSVYTTRRFEKEFDKLSKKEQQRIKKIFSQLKENPYVGDQIRYKFFREKRIEGKRIYYLIYEDFCVVLAVAFENKKAQQETINEIIKMLPEFKKYVEKTFKNN